MGVVLNGSRYSKNIRGPDFSRLIFAVVVLVLLCIFFEVFSAQFLLQLLVPRQEQSAKWMQQRRARAAQARRDPVLLLEVEVEPSEDLLPARSDRDLSLLTILSLSVSLLQVHL